MTLVDNLQRRVTYLRVSLTDRCNYRCTYCMPEHGVSLIPRDEVLTFEEIERVVRAFTRLGVTRVRLTGGEPTVRKDVVSLVARLAAVDGVREICMTTNGHLLADLADPLARAGLASLNVSVDTLDAERFRRITRRGDLGRVLSGIDAARAAGIRSIKLNAVALRGFNDDEAGALCRFAWARDAVPRFIEWMPMSDGELFAPGEFLAAAEVRAAIVAQLGGALVPVDALAGRGPARYWRHEPTQRDVGLIAALTENFCATCNRVRLTARGELHTCLARDEAADLRAPLRAGASDDALIDAIRRAVGGKLEGHGFTTLGCGGPRKHMVAIGG